MVELELNNNHSLTHSLINLKIIIRYIYICIFTYTVHDISFHFTCNCHWFPVIQSRCFNLFQFAIRFECYGELKERRKKSLYNIYLQVPPLKVLMSIANKTRKRQICKICNNQSHKNLTIQL